MSRRGILGILAGGMMANAICGNRSRRHGSFTYPYGPRRRSRSGLLGLFLILIAGYYGTQQLRYEPAPLPSQPIIGRVQHVIDGDTFNMQGYAIRLWGIDAPERETAFGPKSTQILQSIVRGRELTCQPVDRSYERVVAHCTFDGRDVSQIMVRLGWARDLPNKSGRRYAADERDAQSAKRGMWKI